MGLEWNSGDVNTAEIHPLGPPEKSDFPTGARLNRAHLRPIWPARLDPTRPGTVPTSLKRSPIIPGNAKSLHIRSHGMQVAMYGSLTRFVGTRLSRWVATIHRRSYFSEHMAPQNLKVLRDHFGAHGWKQCGPCAYCG
jgi:hypothetical protein